MIGLGLVGLVFAIVTILTWRKWPDITTDFGSQLYLPWKISTGSILYRDVMYLTGGPLSQNYHALLFNVFGTSFLTLIVSNLLLATLLLVVVYRNFLAASDTLTATTICMGIVLVFIFGHYGSIGNYNYISPYCHEITHGLILSILAIAFLSYWLARERLHFVLAAGFCAGLVFLTKPEVFAALALCTISAFILFWATKSRGSLLLGSIITFLLAASVPLVAFLFYFHRFETWSESWRSVFFAWMPLVQSSVSNGFYYRWCMGLDTPGFHFTMMLIHFGAVGVFTGLCALIFRGRSPANRVVSILWIAALLATASQFYWLTCGRSLPLLCVTLCVVLCANYKPLSLQKPATFALLWSVFALGMLAKLGLYSRIWHYGFVLAMPAFVAVIYLFLWVLPLLLERYGVHRNLFRAAALSFFALGFAFLFSQSELHYEYKTLPVGEGRDKIMALGPEHGAEGVAVRYTVDWLKTNAPSGATLAVLPEGVMINYLCRRSNPAGYLVWNPAELEAFGQGRMATAFEKSSPDFIVLLHRNSAEFGVALFGQKPEFGLDVMNWIRENYEAACLIGNEPLQESSSFGVKILKRKAARGETTQLSHGLRQDEDATSRTTAPPELVQF
jgi:hypothetical protein